jgi:hypothetical protein
MDLTLVLGVALIGGVAGGAIAAVLVGVLPLMMSRGRRDVSQSHHRSGPGRWTSASMQPVQVGHATVSAAAGQRAGTGPFDRFNDRAKRAFALAQDEAIRFNHNYIGTEHVLLGLVREGDGVAARVLASLGVELMKVRKAVERQTGRGESTASPSEITLAPQTKKLVELALDDARILGHSHVGTEHLLLALAREGGEATGILESLGVLPDTVRRQVMATLGQQHDTPPS